MRNLVVNILQSLKKLLKKTIKWYLENKDWMNNVTSGNYQEYYKKTYNKI